MFIILTSIAAIVVGLLLYLFFAPFHLEVDNTNSLYRLRFSGIVSLSLKVEDQVYLETSILGWKSRSVLSLYQDKKSQKEKVMKPVRQKRTGRLISGSQLMAVLKSFKVKSCTIFIDTGNMQWNGMLYPVFYWLASFTNKPIGINFQGRNEIELHIQNSLARMSWAFISSK